MEDRIKTESNVIRRMPIDCMANPTLESIDETSFGKNGFDLEHMA
jgi:hypothetical protein